MSMERRKFLKLTAAAGAGAAAPGAIAETARSTLTAKEMTLLKQLLARLLPADETGGGAVEAGAHLYIDRALGGYHSRHLPMYRDGLAAAEKLLSGNVDAPAKARLDAMLGQMEAGKAGAGFKDGGRSFFGLLRTHMIEGTFGDPSYGGNRDYLGWQMIGYPGVQLVVSAAEQAVDGPRSVLNRSMESFGGKAVS